MKHGMYYVLPLLIFLASFTICASAEVHKIGAILGLSGEWAEPNQQFLFGIQQAIQEANQDSHGDSYELIVEDVGVDLRRAVSAAQKLITVDHVEAAFVADHAQATVVAPLFEKQQRPLIVLWDSSPSIDALGENTFGVGSWTPGVGERGAEFAFRSLGARRAAIVVGEDEWCLLASESFEKHFKKLGGEVVLVERYAPGESDFRGIIARARSRHPDFYYLAPLNGVALVKQMRALGIGPQERLLIPDFVPDHIHQLGALADGIYLTKARFHESDLSKKLLATFRDHSKKNPADPNLIAWAYDGARLLLLGIRNAGKFGGSATKAIYASHDVVGVSRPIVQVNAAGSSQIRESVFQVREGKEFLVEE